MRILLTLCLLTAASGCCSPCHKEEAPQLNIHYYQCLPRGEPEPEPEEPESV